MADEQKQYFDALRSELESGAILTAVMGADDKLKARLDSLVQARLAAEKEKLEAVEERVKLKKYKEETEQSFATKKSELEAATAVHDAAAKEAGLRIEVNNKQMEERLRIKDENDKREKELNLRDDFITKRETEFAAVHAKLAGDAAKVLAMKEALNQKHALFTEAIEKSKALEVS